MIRNYGEPDQKYVIEYLKERVKGCERGIEDQQKILAILDNAIQSILEQLRKHD